MQGKTRWKALLLSLAGWFIILTDVSVAGQPERIAYVPSEALNNLVVIDLITAKQLKILPTGKTPHALAFTSGGKGYISNRGSNELTVIDANKLEVIRTIPLSAISFQLALSPDGKLLAIAYKDALKISFIDTETDEIMTTVPIGKEPESFKGAKMKHPFWSRDGKFVYASDNVNNTIVKIDTDSFAVTATIRIPGSNHYLHPSPDAKLLYAVNESTKEGASITVIDSAADAVVKNIVIPIANEEKVLGHHGEFTPDGRFFFFCNEGGRTVAIIDTVKMEAVKTIKAGIGAGHPSMSRDGRQIFVINHNDNMVTVIDTAKQEVVKNITIGEGKRQAHGSYFSPDSRYFYMVNAADNMFVAIDTAKMEVTAKIPVGKSSMYFAIKEGNTFPSVE